MNNNEDIILNVLQKDKTPVKGETEEINFKDVDVVINVPPGDKK